MNSFKIIVLIQFIIFINTTMLYSQNSDYDNLFEISVDLTGVDNSCKNPNYFNYYSILSLNNLQDTAVKFWIMSGSWLKYNWITNNDSISIVYRGSDFDTPTLIELPPHKNIKFYAVLQAKKEFTNKFFKIAFLFYNESKAFSYRMPNIDKNDAKKYWSKPIRLRSKLNRFEIE